LAQERDEKEKEGVVDKLLRQARRKGARSTIAKLAPREFSSEAEEVADSKKK
jgi:hypothetical protein